MKVHDRVVGLSLLLRYGWLLYVVSSLKLEAKAAIVYNYEKRKREFASFISTTLEQNDNEESVKSFQAHSYNYWIFKAVTLFLH